MANTQAAIDVVLRDGSTLCVRPATDEDIDALLQFFATLSEQSFYYRFMGHRALDRSKVMSLIRGTTGPATSVVAEAGGRIVAFAGYYRNPDDPRRAEIAFAVADVLQGHGIGTRLLEHLAAEGRQSGVATFDAYVLGANRRMLDVFHDSGFATKTTIESGICHVTIALAVTSLFSERAAARSQASATTSMKAFFEPRVVAVVGANHKRGKIGSEILHNLMSAGFTGSVVPVHPKASSIEGLAAYKRIVDVPQAVDLAVIVVPAEQVLSVVEDAIAARVRAVCVISAGFGESGGEGRILEEAVLDRVRQAGCRLIGPNCMGLLNTDPAIRLNATFSPIYPPAGAVAMSTQSGALGLAILDYAKRLGIGISSFVSIGNKADVSGNDLIQYWAEDPRTSVILLYLESFGNPKKFSEIARRVGRSKPIVAVKAGRSSAGSRAAASHTGALATSDAVVDALFRQSGVIRTHRLEELFDVAALLSSQPVPRGPRVAILTNAGGPGILAADACEANGLEVSSLRESTRDLLRSFLPAAASVGNPIDMLASAPADHYRRALTAVLEDDQVDSVIAVFIPPLVTDPAAVADAIKAAARDAPQKPVLGVFMRSEGAPTTLAPIPCYGFPESAALALARVTAYGRWRAAPTEAVPVIGTFDRDHVRMAIDRVLGRGGGWTTPEEAVEILTAAGIASAASRTAESVDEAIAAATAIGYPVALKALGPTMLHKSDRRAVSLNIADADAVRRTYADFAERFGSDMTAVLVQRMVGPGVEMIIGAVQDPLFGPLIACGLGGVLVDVLDDTSFRLHPLTDGDVREMLDELRGVRLLRGYRGAPPSDEAAFRDGLLRVSQLVEVAPEIQELDLNPVMVLRSGICVADVRMRIDVSVQRRRGRRVEY